MNVKPDQALLIWKLAINEGEAWLADLTPRTISNNRVRRSLREQGYISEERQKREVEGKKTTRALNLSLEDKGWAWLAGNLDAPLAKSKATAEVLQAVLRMLKHHLEQQDLVLADFISNPENLKTIEERIITAYHALDREGKGERVRISDLHKHLHTINLNDLQQTMQLMQQSGLLTLYPIDNPREITQADRHCEITTTLGSKRHIVYMGAGDDE